ncbi:MAG: hypothetical protein Q8R83_05935 [Legionellaceae bacterium]|nr:hypothetical protein [Legionellaceae bacterium]
MQADIKYLIEMAEESLALVKEIRNELSEVKKELSDIKEQLETNPE